MTTDTELFNRALALVGEKRIASLADDNPRAQLISDIWPMVRQAALRAHPWNFAMRRAVLSPDATAPPFGFTYRFRLPPAADDHGGWLRTIAVFEDANEIVDIQYREEGRFLLADIETIYLKFTADITDPNQMEPLFREALCFKLASELAVALTNSSRLHDTYAEKEMQTWPRAKAIDGLGDPQDFQREDTWLRARRSRFGRRDRDIAEVPE